MFLFTYTAAVIAIIFWVAAAVLFFRYKWNRLTQQFTLFLIFGGLWIGSNAAADVSYTHEMVVFWSGMAFVGGTWLITMYLIFIDTFIDEQLPSRWRLFVYMVPSVFFSIFGFTTFAIIGTAFPPGEPAQLIPGPQYTLSVFWLLGSLAYGITRLTRAFLRSSGRRRMQALYILIGFGALLVGETTFSVVLPLLGELRFFNLAPQFAIIFALTTGYAILRHDLLDIRVVVQRGVIYTILLAAVVAIYISILAILAQIPAPAFAPEIIGSMLATIIGVFTIPSLNRYLKRKTDPIFFKDTYDYSVGLYELSQSINQHIRLENIIKTTSNALQKLLRTESVTITSVVSETEIPADVTLQAPSETLVVPIRYKDTLVGLIHIGPKRSGDLYTNRDLSLIQTFSHQIATAFEKARLYKEVEDYSLQLEDRVAERTAEIERLQAERSQVMLDISHRLQTPLTVVKNELHTLKTEQPDNKEIKAFEKSVDDISEFIYDLLRLSELDTGTTKQGAINLSDLVTELTEYYEVVSADKGVALVTSITPNLNVQGNRRQLEEMLTNLVSNSMKYMGTSKTKKTPEQKITVTLTAEETTVLIRVIDTGIGIKAETLPHVFDRFYRAKDSPIQVRGAGIGLAITKKIVELHGGTIEVASTFGIGTTFTIKLPLLNAAP